MLGAQGGRVVLSADDTQGNESPGVASVLGDAPAPRAVHASRGV